MPGEKDLFTYQPHREVPSWYVTDYGEYGFPDYTQPCETYDDGSRYGMTHYGEPMACIDFKTDRTLAESRGRFCAPPSKCF